MSARSLKTARGVIPLPAFVPVTTLGARYTLDAMVLPYLPRLARCAMVSFHYARALKDPPRLPLMVDSGGFAALFEGSAIREERGVGVLDVAGASGPETLRPTDVLALQERVADVAFTLDFPIPPGTAAEEAERRIALTQANARWALHNRRRKDMLLFACVQAWDAESAARCARAYVGAGFDGLGIGGLVPRARDRDAVLAIVRAVRREAPGLPLHVFGLGRPELLSVLFAEGVDSVDSSSYAQLAAQGRMWSHPGVVIADPSPTERLHMALCNLAAASGRALPLSAASMVFQTHSLEALADASGAAGATSGGKRSSSSG